MITLLHALATAILSAAGQDVRLIILHNPLHREVQVNVAQITSLQQTREAGEEGKIVTDQAQCVVSLTDGKYFSVLEECDAVRQLLYAR